MVRRILTSSFFCLLLTTHSSYATNPNEIEDSTLFSETLDEVVVTAQSYKEVIPAQTLGGKELEALRSHSVADALRYFSGVQLKDYGGVGGIKTVNIRSMEQTTWECIIMASS